MPPKGAVQGRRWVFDDCEYFERGRQLFVAGQPVRVEAKPLDVLQLFLEHPTEVLTKDQLLGEAWEVATSDQSLAVAISKLRKVFGRRPRSYSAERAGRGLSHGSAGVLQGRHHQRPTRVSARFRRSNSLSFSLDGRAFP